MADAEPLFPGDRNFVSDLDVVSKLVTPERCLMLAPVTDDLRAAGGAARLGVLTTFVDVGASDPALAVCRPDWTATQDLSMHSAGWLTEGPVVADIHLVRVGKKVVVVAAEVYDGHGNGDLEVLQAAIDGTGAPGAASLTLAARGLVVFARIPGAAASQMGGYDPKDWLGEVRYRTAAGPVDGAVEGSMYERMGLQVIDAAAGVLELAATSYVANSIGTINGGVQAVLIEAAAEAMRPGLMAADLQVHYLAQIKTGPARTRGTVLRDAADHSVVTIELVDAGHDDQLLSLATVTLQRSRDERTASGV